MYLIIVISPQGIARLIQNHAFKKYEQGVIYLKDDGWILNETGPKDSEENPIQFQKSDEKAFVCLFEG